MAIRRIASVTRLKNSVNGNGRFKITFDDGSSAITQTDSSVSYDVENLSRYEGDLEVKFSRAGRIVSLDKV